MKFNKDLRRRLLLKSSMEDFKRSLPCVDFKRNLLFRSFFQLQIYEERLLKKSILQKTSSEVFLCKYWLTFEIEFSLKFPKKTSLEVFSKSFGSLLNAARSLLGYFCNWLYLTFREKTSFRRMSSLEVFSRGQRFDQNLELNSRRLS